MNYFQKNSDFSTVNFIFYQIFVGITFFSPLFYSFLALSQTEESPRVKLSFSANKIALTESYHISVTLTTGFTIKSPPEFPEITGFDKGELTIRQPSNDQNKEQVFTQHYLPQNTGIFMVKLFRMSVGNEVVSSKKSRLVTVEDRSPRQDTTPDNTLTLRDRKAKIPYFSVGEEGGVLVLEANKSAVFVGEELEVTLYFYRPKNSLVPLDFPEDFYSQVSVIAEQLHPSSCWEERFGVEKYEREAVQVRGQDFFRYRLYRVLFYPFNTQAIQLPSVSMDMLKADVSQHYSRWRLAPRTPVTFRSNTLNVPVRELPPHPLSQEVAVGNFTLKEGISSFTVATGEPLYYRFSVEGYGNLRTTKLPEPPTTEFLESYPPEVEEHSYRQNTGMYRLKTGRYSIVPKVANRYPLSEIFTWVYFNTDKMDYDTLQASLTFEAEGEAIVQREGRNNESKWSVSNQMKNLSTYDSLFQHWGINLSLLLVGGLTVALLWSKQKR